jgi:hypothetical protein
VPAVTSDTENVPSAAVDVEYNVAPLVGSITSTHTPETGSPVVLSVIVPLMVPVVAGADAREKS